MNRLMLLVFTLALAGCASSRPLLPVADGVRPADLIALAGQEGNFTGHDRTVNYLRPLDNPLLTKGTTHESLRYYSLGHIEGVLIKEPGKEPSVGPYGVVVKPFAFSLDLADADAAKLTVGDNYRFYGMFSHGGHKSLITQFCPYAARPIQTPQGAEPDQRNATREATGQGR